MASQTEENCDIQYVFQRRDPAYGMLDSVAVGFATLESGERAECPNPVLNTLAVELTLTGRASFNFGTQSLEEKPDSIVVMLPPLKFHVVAQGRWRSCWFVLWGPLADAYVLALGRRAAALKLDIARHDLRYDVFECCRLIAEQPDAWQWPWLDRVTRVLEFIRTRVASDPEDDSSVKTRATRVMEDNLTRPLPLAGIADALNMSLSSLAHRFRAEAGCSPGHFYKQMRIDKAKQLLVNGLNVAETSEQLGFGDPFHFSRLFKKLEGKSPSVYKDESPGMSLIANESRTRPDADSDAGA